MANFLPRAIIVFLLVFGHTVSAAQNETDSLKLIYVLNSSDSTKIQILHQLYALTDSVGYASQGLELSKKINDRRGIATHSLDIGRSYYFGGQQDIAMEYLISAVQIAEELDEKKILCSAYRYIGYIYRPHDSYTAESYYKKSLKMAEELGDEIAASHALSALGNIYEGIFGGPSENNKIALAFYLRSLEIRERKGTLAEIAASLNETSRIYDLLGYYDKGLELRIKGLEIAEQSGSTENVVYFCNVLGNEYSLRLGDVNKGLEYQLKAYDVGKTLNNNYEIMFDITKGIAYSYYTLGDFKKSSEFFNESIVLNDSIRSTASRYDYNLSMIKHDLESEVERQKLLLKDSEILKNKAETDKQTALRNAFLIGFALVLILILFVIRKNKERNKLNKELQQKNEKIEETNHTLAISEKKLKLITETIDDVFYLYNIREQKYEYVSPNSKELVGDEPDFFYRGGSMKHRAVKEDLPLLRKANEKVDSGLPYEIEYRLSFNNEVIWIEEKSSPIFDEHHVLVRNSGILRNITSRKIMEEVLRKKNSDITDSILYARHIQKAILVPKDEIAKTLSDFFILAKPKDIVSGDFYFYKRTEKGLVVVVSDCTGHGVPAGFMSMMGTAFLNEIITDSEIINPARILDQLRKMIIDTLNKNSAGLRNRDGMDIALLYLDNELSEAQFAGAYNSLYVVQNQELKEIKANKFPIGIHVSDELKPFTNNTFRLQKGDSIYLGTDGFADQFGGPKGKKFMKKRMQALLLSMQEKQMTDQEKILDQAFNNWRGDHEQVDDVMIFGLRV
jgi:serine phosphatase RsbU (regulator of sigma subunit)